jgi:hypothetical protein
MHERNMHTGNPFSEDFQGIRQCRPFAIKSVTGPILTFPQYLYRKAAKPAEPEFTVIPGEAVMLPLITESEETGGDHKSVSAMVTILPLLLTQPAFRVSLLAGINR